MPFQTFHYKMKTGAKARPTIMQNEPHSSPAFDPLTQQPVPPEPQSAAGRKLLAPVWHTIFMVLLMLGYSAFSAWLASQAITKSTSITETGRVLQYVATIALEFFLLFLVWIGLRLYGTKIRDVIGGRWNSFEDVLLDVAIAFGFLVVAYSTVLGLSFALGLAKPSQMDQTKKLASMLAPHTWYALLVFVLLSMIAGFVEEIIFRGYLQRQLTILSGKTYVGLVLSALVFGGGHGYEGTRRMLLIFILGLLFGCLALWRKSLRPGMIGHAMFDSAQGLLLYVATKMGTLSAI